MVLPLIAAAAVASAGIGAIGKILGGIGANSQAKAEAAAYDRQAVNYGEQADQARSEAGANAQLQLSEGNRQAGRAATLAAASGGGLTGSALSVIDDLSSQSLFNARRVTYEGLTEARADLFKAQEAKANAASSRQQGKVALVTGILGGASTVLGAFGSAAAKRKG